MVKETVEEVAVTSTEETEVEAKEVSEDKGSKPPEKGKKGARRSGGNNKALELELQKQKELVDEANDKYKRLLAEFENARNRNEKESKRMYDIGAKEVLEKLLPVVDNFERALQMVPEEDKERGFEQGVDKIYKQLMVALEEIGVAPMNAEGTEFNPDLHNAVMHVEDEAFGENVVTEELQKGYMYKEEVLRHSMVKVAN
ncbi:MAG: nucleotide exchange factor GrpE [Lachnospiraceae bacterium]|nr:nucleotide exchange factor GrpE [Lachnospiraceae bacterium]